MATEFTFEDYILVQDGRTFEIFHRDLEESRRYHVAFLGVDVKPQGDNFKVSIGRRVPGDHLVGGARMKMNQQEFARFREFIALAIAARDQPNTD
jgi:hypothetical protein